jgi:hypothetical protein
MEGTFGRVGDREVIKVTSREKEYELEEYLNLTKEKVFNFAKRLIEVENLVFCKLIIRKHGVN